MAQLSTGVLAPDFEVKDLNGASVKLSAYRGKQPVVLVMTRGFA